jgi:hypothetical protein
MSMNAFPSSHPAARAASLSAVAAATFALTACYVVPIDPRTNQPYPTPSRDAVNAPAYSTPAPSTAPTVVVAAQASQPSLVNVRLYPLNAQANKGGLLQAQVVDNNAGHGTFTVPYLGDLLQGESTRVDAGYPSFGIVHQQVLGAAPRTVTGRRGVANAHGARGVNAQCEYVLTGPGSGTGVCQFSDGAYYQMHFGG